MWLRLLNELGLTNLTDQQIAAYGALRISAAGDKNISLGRMFLSYLREEAFAISMAFFCIVAHYGATRLLQLVDFGKVEGLVVAFEVALLVLGMLLVFCSTCMLGYHFLRELYPRFLTKKSDKKSRLAMKVPASSFSEIGLEFFRPLRKHPYIMLTITAVIVAILRLASLG